MAQHWSARQWRANHWRAAHWSGLGVFPPNVETNVVGDELLGTRIRAAVLRGGDASDELLASVVAAAPLVGFDSRATELLGDSKSAGLEGSP